MANLSVSEILIKYANLEDEDRTISQRKKNADSIFAQLNTNGDGVLSTADNMNDYYLRLFGIDENKTMTKQQLEDQFTSIVQDHISNVVSDSSLKNIPDLDKAKVDKENANKKTAEDKKNAQEKAQIAGQNAYEYINDWQGLVTGTPDVDYTIMNDYLKSSDFNKDTVMAYLEGFYTRDSSHRIIYNLENENSGGKLETSSKHKIVETLIEKAKDVGLGNNDEVKLLQAYLNNYSNKNFSNNGGGWGKTGLTLAWAGSGATAGAFIGGPVGAIIGGVIGGVCGAIQSYTCDAERIDELMYKLYQAIQAK